MASQGVGQEVYHPTGKGLIELAAESGTPSSMGASRGETAETGAEFEGPALSFDQIWPPIIPTHVQPQIHESEGSSDEEDDSMELMSESDGTFGAENQDEYESDKGSRLIDSDSPITLLGDVPLPDTTDDSDSELDIRDMFMVMPKRKEELRRLSEERRRLKVQRRRLLATQRWVETIEV